MTMTTNDKTLVATVLGGVCDEGLNSPTSKQESTMQSTVSTRFQLDERSRVDVEPVGEYVELTITTVDEVTVRSTFGMAFTATEARKLASALLDGVAPDFGTADPEEIEEHVSIARRISVEIPVSDLARGTVTDIFRWSQENGVSAGATMQAVENYIDGMAEAEALSPAQWCKQRRAQRLQGAK